MPDPILSKVWDWLHEAVQEKDLLVDEKNSIREQGVLHVLSSNFFLPFVSFTVNVYGRWALIDAYRRIPTNPELWAQAKKRPCTRLFSGEKLGVTLPVHIDIREELDPKVAILILERAVAAHLFCGITLTKNEV